MYSKAQTIMTHLNGSASRSIMVKVYIHTHSRNRTGPETNVKPNVEQTSKTKPSTVTTKKKLSRSLAMKVFFTLTHLRDVFSLLVRSTLESLRPKVWV